MSRTNLTTQLLMCFAIIMLSLGNVLNSKLIRDVRDRVDAIEANHVR